MKQIKYMHQEVENSFRGSFFLPVLPVLVSLREIISGHKRPFSQYVSHSSHSHRRKLCVSERLKQVGPENNEKLLLSEDKHCSCCKSRKLKGLEDAVKIAEYLELLFIDTARKLMRACTIGSISLEKMIYANSNFIRRFQSIS